MSPMAGPEFWGHKRGHKSVQTFPGSCLLPCSAVDGCCNPKLTLVSRVFARCLNIYLSKGTPHYFSNFVLTYFPLLFFVCMKVIDLTLFKTRATSICGSIWWLNFSNTVLWSVHYNVLIELLSVFSWADLISVVRICTEWSNVVVCAFTFTRKRSLI